MKLSENFNLSELTASTIVPDNSPCHEAEVRLLYLANYILQPIRDRWGAIKISSGFRGQRLNREVGGASTSQHLMGEAADIIPTESDIKEVYRWIVDESRIPFGQCIYEKVSGSIWIHISLVRLDKPNNEALTFDGKRYVKYTGTL